jgi:hypothetical protein
MHFAFVVGAGVIRLGAAGTAGGGVLLDGLSRSYSRVIGSKGLWPQLVRCAPFPSTALYFKGTEVTCPEVRIYSIMIS